MGLALFKERRLDNRRRLTGLLPGRLTKVSTGKDLPVKLVDVSQNGIGIIANEPLEPGSEIQLQLQERHISLLVAWVQPDFGKCDNFRYGLVTLNPEENIEQIFIDSGCLV